MKEVRVERCAEVLLGSKLVKSQVRARCLGDVAQLEEHLLCKQGVVGSSPIVSTGAPERQVQDAACGPRTSLPGSAPVGSPSA